MMSKPWLYKSARLILGPIFKSYYKAKIYGKEYINEEGPLIIACNHIHLYDQCHMVTDRKNVITYMAKKEYFDSWKTRWFFKSVGCIPVNRQTKDHEAVEHALEVLNNKGTIGIFPEGTRNALKEERVKVLYDKYFTKYNYEEFSKKIIESKPKLSQIYFLEELLKNKKISKKDFMDNIYDVTNYVKSLLESKVITKDEYYSSLLLEFKFGAVSMAKKTNAKILPVGISGTYERKSKDLKVRYGKPIDISNMELEEANKLLFKSIKELIKENDN